MDRVTGRFAGITTFFRSIIFSRLLRKAGLLSGAMLLLASAALEEYPDDYFRSPLGIPLVLAGSFAEMRSNHFHSGLDIKTNGRTGFKVYAAQEGFISRVAVSPTGFGNAVYVSHPNGYMTVYAHLERFSSEIQNWVRTQQYSQESFSVNLFPEANTFPVSSGDVIAYSGNSGSSGGPHLHFEVRNNSTGWPENPLLYGFEIPDGRAPRIYRIKVYGMAENSRIRIRETASGRWRQASGKQSLTIETSASGRGYQFSGVDRIEVGGPIAFGIQTHDYHEGSTNRLGAFSIILNKDDQPIFSSTMDRFSFGQTRYINAHIDYRERVRSGRWFQRSHVLPGNRLPLYDAEQQGVLRPIAGTVYEMRYNVADSYGNESILGFNISGIEEGSEAGAIAAADLDKLIRYDRSWSFFRNGVGVQMKAHTLYDDTSFDFEQLESRPRAAFSPVFQIHNAAEPAHEYFTLSIDGSEVPSHLRQKALLARVSSKGDMSSAGGNFSNGVISGSIRAFGNYAIAVDTLAPTVVALNVPASGGTARSSLRFRIRDNFAGIRTYRGEIDGKWVLFAFDAKTGTLSHTIEPGLPAGSHDLRLVVEDRVGNRTVFQRAFRR